MTMPVTCTIAHLSDIHLSPVRGFTPRHWNAKRALGFINWNTKRRHVHLREVADQIVADIKRHQPDHIVVSGDLINIGLPMEYDAASHWLASLGTPDHVSLVPGNHDIYTALGRDPGIERWRGYMTTDEWGKAFCHSAGFPYLRRVGPVAIIGVCSAVETAPGVAIGRLGSQQLAATQRLLERLAPEPLCRLIMIHHPPLPGLTRPRHELLDAADFSKMLAHSSADLVLHGHTHLPTTITLPRANRPLHVIGVASASAGARRGHEPLAQYNLLQFSGSPGNWHVELRRRGFREPGGAIVELAHETFE